MQLKLLSLDEQEFITDYSKREKPTLIPTQHTADPRNFVEPEFPVLLTTTHQESAIPKRNFVAEDSARKRAQNEWDHLYFDRGIHRQN